MLGGGIYRTELIVPQTYLLLYLQLLKKIMLSMYFNFSKIRSLATDII